MATIISCLGQKGGCGKSGLARAIGAELARRKKSVALIDLDARQQTITKWGEDREANEIDPALTVVQVKPEDEPDFRVPELGADHDFIVIDAPGYSDALTLRIAQISNTIVLPTQTSVDDLDPQARLRHELVRHGIEPTRIVLMLSKVASDALERWAREYLKQAEIAVAGKAIPYAVSFEKAHRGGMAITEVSVESLRTAARDAVAEILKNADKNKDAPASASGETLKRFVMKEGETW